MLKHLYSFFKGDGKPGFVAAILERKLADIERGAQERIRISGEAARLVRADSRLLFLCLGNINRSALAERRLKGLLGENAPVASCGFLPRQNRPADPIMVKIAGRNGISLENWASRVISRELITQADLIFAMEAWHLVRLGIEYPESRGRAFLLNCVTQPGDEAIDIADPYGKSPDDYQKCYDIIARATSVLSELIFADQRQNPST